MNKIIKLTFLLSIIIIAASCKKETITTTEVSQVNSEPIVISFGKYNNSANSCTNGFGICVTDQFPTRTQFSDYKLQLNEGKGEAWAETVQENVKLRMDIPSTGLSVALKDSMVFKKRMTFVEDTYIKPSLITSTYKKAGIKDIPTSIKIPRGVYPVAVTGPTPSNPSADFRIKITIVITVLKDKTIIDIKVEILDP
jgi:hypothetical protein